MSRPFPIALGVVLTVIATATVVMGCGIPDQSTAGIYADKDVPFGLADDTTRTSVTEPEVVIGDSVVLYFLAIDRFVSVARRMERPVTLNDVVAGLADGPQPSDGVDGARSLIVSEDVLKVSLQGGVARVDLAPRFRELPSRQQPQALAQLVLTLTERPGVGQVSFTVDGEPTDVPTADGTLSRTAVSRDDYAALLTAAAPTTVTTDPPTTVTASPPSSG